VPDRHAEQSVAICRAFSASFDKAGLAFRIFCYLKGKISRGGLASVRTYSSDPKTQWTQLGVSKLAWLQPVSVQSSVR